MLLQQDFEKFAQLTAQSSSEEHWEAIETLTPHLNDHLVLAGEYLFEQMTPCRLITFDALDDAQTQLYAIATLEGFIVVGKIDDLSKNERLELGHYDSENCEILALAVSGQDYFLGNALNLWVSVKCFKDQTEETLVYHALAGVDDLGQPSLVPVFDKTPKKDNLLWFGNKVNKNKLPNFLKHWNLSCAYRNNPFALPDTLTNMLPAYEAACWQKGLISYAIGAKLIVRNKTERLELISVSKKINAITLMPSNKISGMISCDDGDLIFFQKQGNALIELWRQRLTNLPIALSAFQKNRKKQLLVVTRNGFLKKITLHENNTISRILTKCWQFKPDPITDFDTLISNATTTVTKSAKRQTAVLYYFLQRLFSDIATLPGSELNALLSKILVSNIFQGQDPEKYLSALVMTQLADFLKQFDSDNFETTINNYPADIINRLLDWLYELYDEQFSLKERKEFDQFLNRIEWHERARSFTGLEKLQQRAKRSLQKLLESNQSTGLAALIYRTNVCIEYLANYFLNSDTVLFPEPIQYGILAILGIHSDNDTGYLAVLTPKTIEFYAIPEASKQQFMAISQAPQGDSFAQLLPAYNTNHSSVISITAQGQVSLYSPTLPSLTFNATAPCNESSTEQYNRWLAATCPTRDGNTLLALTNIQNRITKLSLYLVAQQAMTPIVTVPYELKIPWLTRLDIALTQQGYVLAASGEQSVTLCLYQLDKTYNLVNEPRKISYFYDGLLSLCFDNKQDAKYILVGGYSGMIWCVPLATETAMNKPLHWVYRLKGFISSLSALSLDQQHYVLAVSHIGEFCCLGLHDGKLYWQETVNTNIHQLTTLKTHNQAFAILGLAQARISVFDYVKTDDKHFKIRVVNEALKQLNEFSKTAITDCPSWHYADSECLRALYQLKTSNDQINSFASITRLSARARFLRYLLNLETNPSIDLDPRIVKILSLRELGLVLAYLPNSYPAQTIAAWRETVWQELKTRKLLDSEESYAYEMAFATNLSFLAQEESYSLAMVLQHCPSEQLLNKSPWLCTIYANLLIQAGYSEQRPEQSLLVCLIPFLLQLPTVLLAYLPVLSNDEDKPVFVALETLLLKPTRISREEINTCLLHLSQNLRQHSKTDYSVTLLSALCDLHISLRSNSDEAWPSWRHEVLAVLRGLQQALHNFPETDKVLKPLYHGLRPSLITKLCPVNTESLKDRLAWVETAQRQLKQPKPNLRDTNAFWAKPIENLITSTQHCVEHCVNEEHKHVLSLVRPHVSLLAYRHLLGNKLTIELSLIPDGQRVLDDVTVIVDAGRAQGLLAPGHTREHLEYAYYPTPTGEQTLRLDGYVYEEQTQLSIRVTTIASGGYQDLTDWQFPISPASGRPIQDNPYALSFALPELFKQLNQQLTQAANGLTLAILDTDNDRQHVINDWDNAYINRRVDLDSVIADLGAGRLYSARTINLALLEHELSAYLTDATPLLLAPNTNLIQRLLDGEAPGVLSHWLANLAQEKSSIVLLVTSEQARQLRPIITATYQEASAHALLLKERHAAKRPLIDATVDFIQKRTQCKLSEAEAWLSSLGYNVYLLMDWLTQHETQNIELSRFLAQADIKNRFLAELQGLDAVSSVLLLLATRSSVTLTRSQTTPGLIAAQDYYSTTGKHDAKRIQKAGTAFTSNSLNRLNTDLSPPHQLIVQGLSFHTGSLSTDSEAYLALSHRLDSKQRQMALTHLYERGFVDQMQDIIRTMPPYRKLIVEAYSNLAMSPAHEHDSKVYQCLFGSHRTPLDALSLSAITSLPMPELAKLLPLASSEDVKKFSCLAKLWQNLTINQEEFSQAFHTVFGHHCFAIQSPSSTRQRWDMALLKLAPFCLGVNPVLTLDNETYPETYWLWLIPSHQISANQLSASINHSDSSRRKLASDDKQPELNDYTPRIVVTGPIADTWQFDEQRRYAVLTLAHLKQAIGNCDFVTQLNRLLRAQLSLAAFSPFKTHAALPPNSTIFKGRESELAFMRERCRFASLLIIGSRRVGKTSLLNQFYAWSLTEPDLVPVYIDLQGIKKREELLPLLQHWLTTHADKRGLTEFVQPIDSVKDIKQLVQQLATAVQKKQQKLLFLLNEIDGLAYHDAGFIEFWRGLNDQGLAHFIMTGYTIVGSLGLPSSAFFHFTEGTDYGGKAIALSALSHAAASSILDLLTDSALDLVWRSGDEKSQAYALLLKHSYRIPWVLQSYGRLLVRHLEQERRDCLELNDVKQLLAHQGGLVWQYIEEVQYQDFTGSGSKALNKTGFFIVLYIVARERYFKGGQRAPILDPRLAERNAVDLSFTLADVEKMVNQALQQQPIFDNEKQAFSLWFAKLDLVKVFRLLTLTLILEPHPKSSDCFAFLLHMFPSELLQRYGATDPTLDDLLLHSFGEFFNLNTRRI